MSEKVYISDLISAYSLRNTENRSLPVYSVTNSHGFTLSTEYFNKKVFSKDTSNYKIVPFGAFAYNPSRINVGSISWQDKEKEVIVSPLYNVFTLKHNVDARYLNYFFHSPYCMTYINAYATGSVRNTLDLKSLGKIPIILPEEKEQKRVVKILDCLIKIITHRKQALELMNELVKSRFVEMFGDPVRNEKKWIKGNMQSICIRITDGEHGSVPRSEIGHPFLNAKHIKPDGTIDWKTTTFVANEVHEKIYRRCNPETGDILVTTTGTIGNVVIVPDTEPFSMDRGITLLKLQKEKISSIFIAWLLKFDSIQEIMNANIHASAIGHLFLNKVKQLPVIIPPLELQNEFSSFVIQVDKSRLAIQKSLDETQLLFDSLMQKYFG